ncbi:MAG: N-acetylneuraminate synthase [Saprospiraceae bacterium]
MKRTIIIAEAGVNHNGDLSIAKQLIDVAAEAGADYVKFQTFKAENIVAKTAQTADYQKKNLNDFQVGQFEMIKKLELDLKTHYILKEYCKGKNIKFLSTAFDEDSIDLLIKLEMDFFKIPSGEITNKPFIEKIALTSKPVVLSTGMSNLKDIENALTILYDGGLKKNDITILHCNTEYPSPLSDIHLLAMNTIAQTFNTKVGYSDHSLGIEVSLAAVALGATIIEKHFTMSRNLDGPDHNASLEPDELKLLIKLTRNIDIALGGTIKKPSPSEIKNMSIARKSIHTSHPLPKGHVITKKDLVMKRPGTGLSPMLYQSIVGKILAHDVKTEHLLEISDFL